MADSVILRKVDSIERCIVRVNEDYLGYEEFFLTDQMRQDAIVLNLQRACELSIDLANHLIKLRKLGVPQESRTSFTLLHEAELLPKELATQLKKMVAFRNIAIHQYQELDLSVTQEIITKHLGVFTDFNALALTFV